MKKKGQVTLEQGVGIVILVGLLFLVLATIALVGEKYGEAMPASQSGSAVNETVTQANLATGVHRLGGADAENAQSFAITIVYNASDVEVAAGNYSVTDTGVFTNLTDDQSFSDWSVTYTYSYSGIASNVTTDLNTEIANNTSIAGIILTISLVGIVLSILVGAFIGMRKSRI